MKTNQLFGLAILSAFYALCFWPGNTLAIPADPSVRINNFQDHGCHSTPGGPGAPPSGSENPGGSGSSCPTCHNATGLPEWWVDEPYINLHIVDEPLSYTTENGVKIPFRFYYKQRYMWPKADQIPSLMFNNISRDQTDGFLYYLYAMRCYGGISNFYNGMTNAAWAHNWMMDILYWDAPWEADVNQPTGTSVAPFSQQYEALVFRPEGDITYFATGSAQPIDAATVTNNPSQTALSFFPYGYAYLTGPLNPYSDGLYYGYTNSGITLSYPDGSRDVFTLGIQPYNRAIHRQGPDCSTSHALLTQRIDAQNRVTYVGYQKFTNSGSSYYRVRCVVDPDGRKNFFNYSNATTFTLESIQDVFGRTIYPTYNSSGWITGIKDAVGTNNTFGYPYGSTSGWVSSMATPYGTTSFSYYSDPDTSAAEPDRFFQLATLVNEPGGASQLFAYVDDASAFIEQTNKTPIVPGVSFDSGVHGDGAQALSYRDTFHWDRKQFADITSFPGLDSFATMMAANFWKATMSHWLDAPDEVSITEEISSVRSPSPDPTGGTEGEWTWYSYGYPPWADQEYDPQVAAIANVLPDGTSQYTRYGYAIYPALPWVIENDQSYSKPGGSLGELTNIMTYAANGIDLLSRSNNFGQYVNMGYNGYHEVTSVTNALGQVTFFGYGGATLTSMTLSSGKSFNFYYTNSSNPTNVNWLNEVTIQPENITETIGAWNYGLPQTVQVTGTGIPTLLITNSWDALNRLTGTMYQDGTTISNIYAARDLIRHQDRDNNWTSNTFDSLDHLVGFTNALGNYMTFGWCGCGSLTEITDFTGTNHTYFNLDNQEQVTNVLFADGSSYTDQIDLLGRVTKRTDGSGKFQEFRYNNQNLVTNIANAYGTVLGVIYDPLNRPTNVMDINGDVTTNAYDLLNELTVHGYVGGAAESFTWASNGLVKFVNLDGQPTYYGRDAAGRMVGVTNALNQSNALSYNALDELMVLVDGNGHKTQWGYNQWGWLTSKTNHHGTTVAQYAYDGNGHVITRTLAGTNTTYHYDAAGNLRAVLYPATSNVFTYDPDNRLQSASTAFGAMTYGYTGASQLSVEAGPGGTVNYTYNQGRRNALTLGSWSQTYAYDNAWRLQNITSPAGSFTYNYASTPSPLPQGIQLPNGATISYGYDALARLTGTALANYWGQIIDGEACGRDPLGLPTNIVRYLGLTTNHVTPSYDAIAQVTAWLGAENGTNRLNEQLKYQYDPAGNLVTRTNNALVQTFVVNPLNEISTVSRTGTLTFSGALPEPASGISANGTTATQYSDLTFAAPGLTLANGSNPFTVAATNKYGLVTNDSFTANLPTTVSFQCDTNGNLTSDGLRTFQYDAENQLTNVYIAGQWQVGFIYDALNRRRAEQDFTWSGGAWVKTNETHFLYDGMQPIQELNTNNTVLVTYTRGLDLSQSLTGAGGIGGLLARTDTNGSTFYHSDLNGNITALMDQYQHIVARYEYGPFGQTLGQWGPYAAINRYGFSSKERATPAPIYYFGGRFYLSNPGRFANPDPIGEASGANLYQAMANNTLYWVDPYGFFQVGPLVTATREALEEEAAGGGPEDPAADVAAGVTLAAGLAVALLTPGDEPTQALQPTDPTSGAPTQPATQPSLAGNGPPGPPCPPKKAPPGFPGDEPEKHHRLPRQFDPWFREHGLNPEDFTQDMPMQWHRGVDIGIHPQGYNGAWQQFMLENPFAEPEEIIEQMMHLENRFGFGRGY